MTDRSLRVLIGCATSIGEGAASTPEFDDGLWIGCTRCGFSISGPDPNAIIATYPTEAEAKAHGKPPVWNERLGNQPAGNGIPVDPGPDPQGTEALIRRLQQQLGQVTAALVDHNDLLRSAFQIAKREGVDGQIASTNWDTYYNRVAVVLKRHHDTTNEARAAMKEKPQ